MGVQGLWTLVAPAARPVKLESLRDRKLAIDASIWIHQFMRTMRSEDGSVLRNGHILGFFRRICKLLFYNIKPVFVFDGGAPALKRSTIRERRKRRQGIQENVKRTAEKILKAQMKAQLLQEEDKRRLLAATGRTTDDMDADGEENYVYLEDLDHTTALDTLRHQNAIKQDQYQLPPLLLEENTKHRKMDPRLASDQELLDFIEEFKPSDIDMDSSVFQGLPPEIQYEIIQDLKLKSRQTSWARLDNMIRQSKTPLDFSKQQILQLKHRNSMTQRVMHMNDMASQHQDNSSAPSRIASERGKEYLLVKNENLEEGLGWRLPGMAKTKSSSNPSHQHTASDVGTQNDIPAAMVHDQVNLSTTEAENMEDDPVARAVASNPRLAALMGDFDNTDDEYDLEPTENFADQGHEGSTQMWEEYDYGNDEFDDDTPLFGDNKYQHAQRNESPTKDDYGQGVDNDDALDQILMKMYQGDENDGDNYTTQSKTAFSRQDNDSYLTPSTTNTATGDNDEDVGLELDADAFYQLWHSRIPDAFMYMHSFNDNYNSILKNAISDATTISDLESQLHSVQKMSGKSNSNDTMQQTAYAFHQDFLKSALAWKQRLVYEQSLLTMFQQQHNKATANATSVTATTNASLLEEKDEPLILSDDDASGDDDIQLVDSGQQQIPPVVRQDINQELSGVSTANATDGTQLEREFLSSTLLGSSMDNNISQTNRDIDHTLEEELVNDVELVASDVTEDQKQDTTDIGDNSDEELAANGTVEEEAINLPEGATDIGYNSDEGLAADGTVEEEAINLPEGATDIGYNSDEELAADGTVEDENNEFARFVSDIASRDIGSVRQELQDDVDQLNKQQTKQMGNADTISDQMVHDIQELLQLFGVPYVVSPMEAEAQCAYLVEHNLVDGVVTDDSDVFLFGGERVYKNMFSQQKYVECYLLQDIAREMHLDRKKLIQLAYFLGSDYTPGIPGVGYVSAMEILGAFDSGGDGNDDYSEPLESPLQRFKTWFEDELDKTEFEKKFRKKHKHLDIPADFPNPLIKDAYYNPLVNTSLEKFSWSPPQLDSLRVYLMKSFAWSEEKTDEILIPVIREMNQRQATGVQTSISSFFDASAGLQASNRPSGMKRKHKSKRIQQVVKQLGKKTQKYTTDGFASDGSSDSETADGKSGNPKRRPYAR